MHVCRVHVVTPPCLSSCQALAAVCIVVFALKRAAIVSVPRGLWVLVSLSLSLSRSLSLNWISWLPSIPKWLSFVSMLTMIGVFITSIIICCCHKVNVHVSDSLACHFQRQVHAQGRRRLGGSSAHVSPCNFPIQENVSSCYSTHTTPLHHMVCSVSMYLPVVARVCDSTARSPSIKRDKKSQGSGR